MNDGLREAASALAHEYATNKELTAFTALDGEEFYEYAEDDDLHLFYDSLDDYWEQCICPKEEEEQDEVDATIADAAEHYGDLMRKLAE